MTKHAGSFWVVPAVNAESWLSSLAPPSELSQQPAEDSENGYESQWGPRLAH